MMSARTSTLATLRGEHRAHRNRMTGGCDPAASRSAMPRPMRRCRAVSRWARCMRCLPRPAGRARRRQASSQGSAGAHRRAAAAALGAAGFCRTRIGRAVDEWLCRTRSRSAPAGDRARGRRRSRVADRGRCAGLRCVGRGGAGTLGRDAPARSRRQPQADLGRAGLRRHRLCCCGWRQRRARRRRRRDGSCARRIRRPRRHGRRGARRCSTPHSSATVTACSAAGSWNGNVMSAFSQNKRRILSLWLPRLPIDRIRRKLVRDDAPRFER